MFWASCDSKIIIKEQMNGGNVPLAFDDTQSLKFRIFIFYTILSECFFHIKWPA